MDEYIPDRVDSLSTLDRILEAMVVYGADRKDEKLRASCYFLTAKMILDYYKAYPGDGPINSQDYHRIARWYLCNLLKTRALTPALIEYYGGSEKESTAFAEKILWIHDYLYSPKGPFRHTIPLP